MSTTPIQKNYDLLVSIILVIDEFHHLATNTLNSILSQTHKDFEIIIIETGASAHDLQLFKEYSKYVTQVHSHAEETISAMMNKGLSFARGKYVHFMFPGDVYLSKHSFQRMFDFLQNKNFPDIVLSPYMIRDGMSAPRVSDRCFSLACLKKGKIPSRIQSTWIDLNLIKSLKGFDRRYKFREGLDLFCRIFQSQKYSFAYAPHVLADYEFFKRPPRFILGYLLETMKVIFRNFGMGRSLLWFFFQDHLQIVKWLLRSVQRAFFKD